MTSPYTLLLVSTEKIKIGNDSSVPMLLIDDIYLDSHDELLQLQEQLIELINKLNQKTGLQSYDNVVPFKRK